MINDDHYTGRFSSISLNCELSVTKQSSNKVDILVRCGQVVHVKITRGEMRCLCISGEQCKAQ